MNNIYLTILALTAVFAVPVIADTPNRITQSFPEFLAASGCMIVDKGGYTNLASVEGGPCPASVLAAFTPVRSSATNPGSDGIYGTADDFTVPGDN